MIDFQQRRKIRRIFYSKITFVVLILLVLFMSKQVYDIYKKETLSRENLQSISGEYNSLKSRQKMLTSEIDRLKTDEGIEEEIRDKFSVAKPGEQVVVIVDSSSTVEDSAKNSNVGFWQKIIDWFK
jgi:cell division protein FtsB